ALGLPDYNVTTARLQAYRGETGSSKAQTLYVAYVPSEYVDQLNDMIKDPNSKFYTAAPSAVGQQLASHVDREFNILSVVPAGSSRAGTNGSSSGSGRNSGELKTALIGVSCALGGVIALFLCWRVWKAKREGPIQLRGGSPKLGGKGGDRPLTIASFAGVSTDHHGSNQADALYLAGRGANGAAGVHRSASGSDRGTLREVWEPSGEERQRAVQGGHNALTETWELSDAEAQAHGMGLYAAGDYRHSSSSRSPPATGVLIDTQFIIDDGEHEHVGSPAAAGRRSELPASLHADGIMRELDDGGRFISVQRGSSQRQQRRRQQQQQQHNRLSAASADPFADTLYVGGATSSSSGVLPPLPAVVNTNRNSRMTERSDGSSRDSVLAPEGIDVAAAADAAGEARAIQARSATSSASQERSSLMSTLSIAERALHVGTLTESQRIQLEFYEQQQKRLSGRTSGSVVRRPSQQKQAAGQSQDGDDAAAAVCSPFGDDAAVSASEHGAATVRTRASGYTTYESAQSHARNSRDQGRH
ncbi:hypothetical protein V8E36_009925, partial [Tilletia maclaganii]